MKIKTYLPLITVFGIPIISVPFSTLRPTLRRIKAAGFDGVEIHIAGFRDGDLPHVYRVIQAALEVGLEVSIHQAWSLGESPTFKFNHVLSALRLLPRDGYMLDGHLPQGNYRMVVYADRYREAIGHPSWSLQTCSTENRHGEFELPYRDFVPIAKEQRPNITVDTQHLLEWMHGKPGVEHLPQEPKYLLGLWKMAWDDFGPLVDEIHFCDCRPSLGHTRGRNVPLGTGILPLREFADYVMKSGWRDTMTVTPETGPFGLIALRDSEKFEKLKELRRTVASFFDED